MWLGVILIKGLAVNFPDHFNISVAGDIILSKPVSRKESATFDLDILAFDKENIAHVSENAFLAYYKVSLSL